MKIITTHINKPPRIVIYGVHGIGKSTFGSECPKPIFIQTESGLDALGVEAFELATNYEQVLQALEYLIDTEHQYQTVVVDSLDWLEKLIFQHVARMKGVTDISEIPFGRGYVAAENEWKLILDRLNILNDRKKMLVLLLAHAQIKRFEAPDTESYDRYQLDLRASTAALMFEYSDIVGFARYRTITQTDKAGFTSVTKAKSDGSRILHLEERPAYSAKNRYRLPHTMPFGWAHLSVELKKAVAECKERVKGNLADVVAEKSASDLKKISGKKAPNAKVEDDAEVPEATVETVTEFDNNVN